MRDEDARKRIAGAREQGIVGRRERGTRWSDRGVVGQFKFLTYSVTNQEILLAKNARREKKFKLTHYGSRAAR